MQRFVLTAFCLLAVLAGSAAAQQPAPASKAETRASKPATVVNINTATAAELQELPGVGAKTAARIVDYRTKKGPFRKIEELMNVQGVGEKSFLKLRPQLTVGAPSSPAQQ
jgi:competence protein ComEA